jgi:tetratricopeptide (TPR) repeat protein
MNEILRKISNGMSASEIITILDRCSLLMREEHFENIARSIVASFGVPEHLTNHELADVYCFGFGKVYSMSKEYKKAIEYFDKALNIESNHIASSINKGEAYGKLGKTKEALELYDEVLKIEPKKVEALYNKGNTLLDLKEYYKVVCSIILIAFFHLLSNDASKQVMA